ncbi:MAG: DNA-binding protein [Bacilli bacterium]|nr:DNA-binding protein [Bacilli bacterium]MBQ8902028.1 DNA-binding protein [Bacilli bacterium]
MEKFLYYNELYLIYKDLINDKTSEIFDLYYGENLSMQEIADIKEISKSRVGIIIKNAEKKLDTLENALRIYEKNNKLNNLLEINDINKIKEEIEKIIKGE